MAKKDTIALLTAAGIEHDPALPDKELKKLLPASPANGEPGTEQPQAPELSAEESAAKATDAHPDDVAATAAETAAREEANKVNAEAQAKIDAETQAKAEADAAAKESADAAALATAQQVEGISVESLTVPKKGDSEAQLARKQVYANYYAANPERASWEGEKETFTKQLADLA